MAWSLPPLPACRRSSTNAGPSTGLASAVAAVPPGPATDPLMLTPGQRAEAERILGGMATLETKALLYFALQNAPFESFPNFRTYRDRVRFIASYALLLKAGNPGADLTVAWEALHRQHRLIETALPTLLSRMVGVVGMHIEDRTLHGLLQSGLVGPEEAGRLLAIIKTTDPLRPTLLETMAMEAVYVERIYHKLGRQAPLGTWLLEAIYGDPVPQFRDLASRAETLQTDEMRDRMRDFGLTTPRTHILVLIAWPNLLRARTVIREREALHAVLQTELARCAGQVATFPDPFTGAPLPSLASAGRTIWYSAGPNGRDESLGGDDIAFDKPLP